MFGLENLIPKGKNLEYLDKQCKKKINVSDPAKNITSCLLPLEAEIHKKAVILFGNICRSGFDTIEWKTTDN